MEILLLIAALVVLVGGLGVLVVSRRSESSPGIEPPATRTAVVTPPAVSEDDAPGDAAATDAPAAVDEAPPEPEPVVETVEKPTFRDRLSKARSTFSGYVGSLLSRSDITAETWDELEEALIRADVGVTLTTALLDELRATVKAEAITEPPVLVEALKSQLKAKLAAGDRTLRHEPGGPNVWLFVGVNGVGKTTSIGKVGKRQIDEGRSVIMAAGDTFRAAAAEQLQTWAERSGADFHRGEEGGDPSSVIFDAVAKAGARDIELVLADTAGRLHTKSNLMDELAKVRRVADRDPGNVTEVLLVLDATTGQNGLQQAKQFSEATQCTGVVLTKLDGSAKGGIALAIALDPEVGGLGLPIKLVGLGEQAEDLIDFDPDAFVDALFDV
ncbi:signal recognition particle-docking protein FtsY [Actinospongicola halichondriae]|uniref:signal recognition particle-docking protein FtsY n=1 Tax=Actinospongicola halichondriae TaxID=3236844 RepID=UPI003D456ACF